VGRVTVTPDPFTLIPFDAATIAALGITRAGVLDDPMGATTEVVLLLLAPANDPSGHLRRMAAAAGSGYASAKDAIAQLLGDAPVF